MQGKYLKLAYGIGVFGPLFLLVLCFYSSSVLAFLHVGVDILAGGRSVSKVFVFLPYLSLLFLLALIPFQVDRLQTIKEKLPKLFFSTVCFLYALTFVGFLFFIHTYGFSWNDFIITFNNEEISSTGIAHNQIGKGVIGFLLSLFGFFSFQNLDAGHAYLSLLPDWFFITLGLILFSAIILSLLTFLARQKENQSSPLYILLYAALSFGVIERSFDGGILDPRNIVLLGLFYFLLFGFVKIKKYIVTLSLLFVAALSLLWFYQSFGVSTGGTSFISGQTRAILSLVAYLGCFAFLIPLAISSYTKKTKIIAFLIALISIGVFFKTDNRLAAYRAIPLSYNESLIALFPERVDARAELVSNILDLGFFKIPAGAYNTVGELIDTHQVLDNIGPVTVPGVTCALLDPKPRYGFTLTTRSPLIERTLTHPLFYLELTPLGIPKPGLFRYQALLTYEPCTPRRLNVIDKAIQSLGKETFFMHDLDSLPYKYGTTH